MRFFKASSAGNAFLVIREAAARRRGQALGELAARLCRTDTGIGADGVVFLRRRRQGTGFRIFNRDGGEAELSGNGMASAAAFLMLKSGGAAVTLDTRVGPRRVELLGGEERALHLRVEIGPPDFTARHLFPFLDTATAPMEYRGIEFFPVSVGNPHAVVFREGAETGWAAVGERLAGAPIFPCGVNVEVVTAVAPDRATVRFWERGVGRTPASSTGSSAAFAVLRARGLVDPDLTLESEGGEVLLSERLGAIQIEVTTLPVARGDFWD